jgi:hypothetical protein
VEFSCSNGKVQLHLQIPSASIIKRSHLHSRRRVGFQVPTVDSLIGNKLFVMYPNDSDVGYVHFILRNSGGEHPHLFIPYYQWHEQDVTCRVWVIQQGVEKRIHQSMHGLLVGQHGGERKTTSYLCFHNRQQHSSRKALK